MRKTIYFECIICLILILTNMTWAAPSHAQNTLSTRPLTAGFLFEFAQKLFGRGEFDEAKIVLKKILKSDSENSSVQRLLKSIDDQKSKKTALVSSGSRPSDIASDIIFIQKNVIELERRNRDLEFTIRKIIQENTFLFQTLSRRNHELLELQKKFFGYDGTASRQVNAGSTQKTNEILSDYQNQIAERDRAFLKRSQEISRVMKDVGGAKELLQDNKETSQRMDSAINILEWKSDLTEKRSYLVDKALALYEKNKDLIALHAELSAVSKSLKEANENYGDTVEEYEVRIHKLNNIWVQDKAKQQVEIDRLKDQIRDEKVKMLAARLDSANNEPQKDISKTQDKVQKVKEEKNSLARNIKSMKSDVKKEKFASQSEQAKEKAFGDAGTMAKVDPQSEIKRLQSKLAQKEKELSDRSRMFDAKIRDLKGAWAKDKTIEQQSMIHRKSNGLVETADEDALKASDVYKDVVQQLDYLKDQLSMKEDALNKFQDDMVSNTSQLEELQKKISQRDSRLADMDALIVTKDQQISALKRELVYKVIEIKQKNKVIEELKAQATAYSQAGIKDLGKRVVAIKPVSNERGQPVEELRALVAELQDRMEPEGTILTNSFEDLKQQLAGSLEALQQKDQEIQALKAQLDDDKKLSEFRTSPDSGKDMDARVRDYEEVIDRLKSRLAAAVSERRDAQKNWEEASKKLSDLMYNMQESNGDGDAAFNQIDELNQKVSDLNHQIEEQAAAFDLRLQTLKDKIAQRDAEISSLKSKLAEKEKQVSLFYESMENATSKLSANLSIRKDQKPTEPVLISQINDNNKPVPAKDTDQKDWNPADNDVYALQQRLNTLGKELKYTQNELASRAQESSDLHERLKEKEFETSEQSKGVSRTKDISKLEKELALIKQQSDLTKTTIKLQQASLAKSQKEVDLKEKSLKSVVDQLEKLKKQTGDYQSTIKEKDEQITLQQKALDHEIIKNETLKRKLKDINQMIGAEQDLETGKSKSTADLKNSLKTYEIRERDYKRQINEIQDQLKSSYVMIEDGEKRITTLKQRLEAREERVAALEEELFQRKGVQKQADDPKAVGQEK
jgi:chromosome segregation ATPase